LTIRSNVNNNLRYITYGKTSDNNLFVAVGDSGTIITSQNGITWTSQSSGVTYDLKQVIYGNN
jgi:hypothetical protein